MKAFWLAHRITLTKCFMNGIGQGTGMMLMLVLLSIVLKLHESDLFQLLLHALDKIN